MDLHSFDRPRNRPAPLRLRGRSLEGSERSIDVTSPTLIVAVKPNCDSCREFVHGNLDELAGVAVVVVSATSGDQDWASVLREILVAPDLMTELEIRSAPYYVLIEPSSSSVVAEGSLFSPAQVASEIERYLNL